MFDQLSLLDIPKPPPPTGRDLADKGIKRAVSHAEQIQERWRVTALEFLYFYIQRNDRFQVEDVRKAAKGIIPEPPSLRAWGGIIRSAAARGWVRQVGIEPVQNATAHCANAAVWQRG